jgi:hypothetical protein
MVWVLLIELCENSPCIPDDTAKKSGIIFDTQWKCEDYRTTLKDLDSLKEHSTMWVGDCIKLEKDNASNR